MDQGHTRSGADEMVLVGELQRPGRRVPQSDVGLALGKDRDAEAAQSLKNGKLSVERATQTSTSAGSRDRAENELAVMPMGSPPTRRVVVMVTPLAKRARTSRSPW